jgi:GxxExxY protein
MPNEIDRNTRQIIGAAIDVHKELGPGLLESAYEDCLGFEFAERGLQFARQQPLPLIYKGRRVGAGFRVDFIVEESVIVEIKSVERLEAVHTAQVLSYLRLSRCTVGLLFNFNVKWLADHGLKRIVLGFRD